VSVFSGAGVVVVVGAVVVVFGLVVSLEQPAIANDANATITKVNSFLMNFSFFLVRNFQLMLRVPQYKSALDSNNDIQKNFLFNRGEKKLKKFFFCFFSGF
jgi:hypothetical protein